MNKSVPSPGFCPQCSGFFEVVARTGVYASLGAPISEDMLEWRCANCGHLGDEKRRRADGTGGEWPASKFALAGQ